MWTKAELIGSYIFIGAALWALWEWYLKVEIRKINNILNDHEQKF